MVEAKEASLSKAVEAWNSGNLERYLDLYAEEHQVARRVPGAPQQAFRPPNVFGYVRRRLRYSARDS